MFNIPTVPTSEELLGKAFRRSVRARAGKSPGRAAEKTMILTASNILADNLRAVVRRFPNFDEIGAFYAETIDIVVGLDQLRISLASVTWASTKIHQLSRAAIRGNIIQPLSRQNSFSEFRILFCVICT